MVKCYSSELGGGNNVVCCIIELEDGGKVGINYDVLFNAQIYW